MTHPKIMLQTGTGVEDTVSDLPIQINDEMVQGGNVVRNLAHGTVFVDHDNMCCKRRTARQAKAYQKILQHEFVPNPIPIQCMPGAKDDTIERGKGIHQATWMDMLKSLLRLPAQARGNKKL